MLEELVLLAARWGIESGSIERICDMDVVSFSLMSSLMQRIEARDSYTNAWTGMVSAQGNHKGMKQWTKPWLRIINGTVGGPTPGSGVPSDDSDEFKKRFQRGI